MDVHLKRLLCLIVGLALLIAALFFFTIKYQPHWHCPPGYGMVEDECVPGAIAPLR